MIVEILVTGGEAQHPLGHQLAHGMFEPARGALIAEASGQFPGDAQALVHLAQQEHAAIRAQMAAGEIGDDFERTEIGEKQRFAGKAQIEFRRRRS